MYTKKNLQIRLVIVYNASGQGNSGGPVSAAREKYSH